MQHEILVVLRFAALLVFIASIFAGVYLFRNYDQLFGPDPDIPDDGPSSRAYSKVQVFTIWAHVFFGSGAAILFLR